MVFVFLGIAAVLIVGLIGLVIGFEGGDEAADFLRGRGGKN